MVVLELCNASNVQKHDCKLLTSCQLRVQTSRQHSASYNQSIHIISYDYMMLKLRFVQFTWHGMNEGSSDMMATLMASFLVVA